MDSRWDQYYGIVRKVSSLAGQWPYQRRRVKILGLIIVTLVTLSLIVPQIAKLVECDGHLPCIFPTFASYLLSSIALVKLYTCHLSSHKIRGLTDQLFVDWDLLRSPEEHEIMKKYAENGRRYSLGYSLYCFISLYMFLSMALIPQFLDAVLPLNETRPLILTYPAYYFVDDRKYFYYIFWHAVVAWEVAMIGIVAHDCMLVTYVEHVCGIFAIVGFAQLLEDTFSLTLAIQIVMITVMVSITLIQITLELSDLIEAVRYIVYVLAQLIHLFCLSFEGQKLIDHSLQTREKIYNIPWYEIPVKSQRMLLFVLKKSIYPTFMSAGKIYIFSMENFTTILQTSMSYFTVLASLE
ncbi:uncharacterized protein LOC116841414 [Odontomachus brunneus]|uniref:uncharacterized protein LOC116841414 n=1 Tax=Odontomachus brunneus TaxID=486640 RepID=UPI0013F27195|nr:uncharacterized protein LOC116841414 [Odontomachus brunneus]